MSKSVSVPASQLTPPGKVPASPEYTPMTPESNSFYPEDHYDTPAPSPVEENIHIKQEYVTNNNTIIVHHQSNQEGSSLADLDNLTDILPLTTNWQFDIGSLDLSKLADTDFPNFDANVVQPMQNVNTVNNSSSVSAVQSSANIILNANPSSHFEFPDYSTPEVSEMIGLESEWLDMSTLGVLTAAH